ncbi:MAG: DUF4203 domain-containing protein [Actinomycetota bacterium]
MNDIVAAVLAILTGLVFCYRGYLAMRIVIPIWGAFAGFVLGAGLAGGDDGFLGNATSWIVGIALALLFGLIAYLYYEVAVILGMMAIGFVLGTSLMVAFGVSWSWVVTLVGVIVAIALAVIGVIGDLPMVLLTVLTALAGASTVVLGLMLLFNVIDASDLNTAATTQVLDDDWWWYVIYLALALSGMVTQFSDTKRRRETLRSAWRNSPTV